MIKFFLTIGTAIFMWSITLLPFLPITNEMSEDCKVEGGYDMECINNAVEINKKIKDICNENKDIDCEDIQDYCYESLFKGQECYFFNFG